LAWDAGWGIRPVVSLFFMGGTLIEEEKKKAEAANGGSDLR